MNHINVEIIIVSRMTSTFFSLLFFFSEMRSKKSYLTAGNPDVSNESLSEDRVESDAFHCVLLLKGRIVQYNANSHSLHNLVNHSYSLFPLVIS